MESVPSREGKFAILKGKVCHIGRESLVQVCPIVYIERESLPYREHAVWQVLGKFGASLPFHTISVLVIRLFRCQRK